MLALLFARAVSADKNHKIGLCTELLNDFKKATPGRYVSTMAKKLDMEAPHLTLSADLIYNPSVESADLNAKSPKMPVTILSATEDKEKSTVKGRAHFGEKRFEEVQYTCHKNSVGDNIHFHVKALNQNLVPAVCDLLEYMVRLRMPIRMDKSMLSYDDEHERLNVQLHGGEWPDFDVAVNFTAVKPKTRMTNYIVGMAEVGSKSVAFQCHAGSSPVHDPFHIHFYKLSKKDVSKAEAKQTKGASSEIPYGMISLMFFLASAILACSMFGAAYLYRKKQKLTPKAPAPTAPAAPTAGELV